MKSSRIAVVVAVLAVTLVAALALSQTVKPAHMHGRGMFGEHMLGFYADYLNLTDAQQAQIKQIMENQKSTIRPLFQQMGQNRQAMRQLVQSGNFDEAKARTIATQQAQSMIELEVQKAKMEAAMFQVLTPDQQSKLVELTNRREQRFMKHMQESQPQNQ
ncbi:MAG TPA: Spy/CpxP family protein refolding chaperone [Terriglobales bacterium]|jgi:protein CpxP|nr:Spy/CpxP family protein refolding chaperone [Terriglobales bacterium]